MILPDDFFKPFNPIFLFQSLPAIRGYAIAFTRQNGAKDGAKDNIPAQIVLQFVARQDVAQPPIRAKKFIN